MSSLFYSITIIVVNVGKKCQEIWLKVNNLCNFLQENKLCERLAILHVLSDSVINYTIIIIIILQNCGIPLAMTDR